MNDKLLKFIQASLQWSSSQRGRDLAKRVAESLKQDLDVPAGFFVYRERQIPRREEDRLPQVYVPWGGFRRLSRQLEEEIDWLSYFSNDLQLPSHQWVRAVEAKGIPQHLWLAAGIRYIGVWPLTNGSQHIGAMVLGRMELQQDDSDVIQACAGQVTLMFEMLRARRKIEEMSKQDSLTGILNRRGMMEEFPQFQESVPEGKHIILGVLDIDDFKSLNDTYGHLAGDEALVQTGQILKEATGDAGLCARWGGDEMVFVMHTDLSQQEATSYIRKSFQEKQTFSHKVSIGLAVWGEDGSTWDECFHVADTRLYAYRNRNNRV